MLSEIILGWEDSTAGNFLLYTWPIQVISQISYRIPPSPLGVISKHKDRNKQPWVSVYDQSFNQKTSENER